MRQNVYEIVTNKIVEQLQKGIIPWQKPWSGFGIDEESEAINYVTRKPYSLLNQMLLGRGGEWLTYKQIEAAHGRIKKGAKAGIVVFYTMLTAKQENAPQSASEADEEAEAEEVKKIPYLQYYNVFHIDDCEGIETKIKKVEKPKDAPAPIELAERAILSYVAQEKELTFVNDKPSDDAFYSPREDKVVVPMLTQYEIAEEYYSTTFHEFVHSTMKETRCNRRNAMKFAAFGSDDYSREELVAEIGSAMLCRKVGIDCDKAFKNSVAYIKGWLRHLQDDTHAIVWAASRAEKAARYIIGE